MQVQNTTTDTQPTQDNPEHNEIDKVVSKTLELSETVTTEVKNQIDESIQKISMVQKKCCLKS